MSRPSPVIPPTNALRPLADLLSSAVFPGDPGYETLAMPWNVTIRQRPLVVVDAADAQEVARAVEFAAERGIPVAVQCTGHGAADALDDAILVRTGRLGECVIHAEERWARVGAGVAWKTVLEAAAPHGLAALAGSSPGVGVVGYTTGGGVGPLARTLGAASDRVRAFEVVTGDGRLRRVTPDDESELFWALRGGKGATGIVTAVEFDLLPIPVLYAGALYFDGADAAPVLRAWASWCVSLPPEATTSIGLLQLPELPMVPPPLAGRFTVAVRFAWTGDAADGEAALAPMRAIASPLIDAVGSMPYVALGMIHSDPVDPMPSHESSALLGELPADAVERLLAVAGPGSGSPQILVEVRQLGGAVAAGGPIDSAFGRPDAPFTLFTVGIGAPPVGAAVASHAVAVADAMAPWLTGRALPNFAAGGSRERFARVFPPETLERLRRASEQYDPVGVLVAGRGLRAAK
jgi:FAD/FMN-containing dehydrogenase